MEKSKVEELHERICDEGVVLSSNGLIPPETLEKNPADILLVPSLVTAERAGLGLQKLAERCHMEGLNPLVFSFLDNTEAADRLYRVGATAHRMSEILAYALNVKTIGFSVFDQDLPFILEFLRGLNEKLGELETPCPLQKIYIGGVGIRNSFSLWYNRLKRLLDRTGLELPVFLVRGEGEDVLPRLLKGESVEKGVVYVDKNSNTTPPEPEILTVQSETRGDLLRQDVLGERWSPYSGIEEFVAGIEKSVREILAIREEDVNQEIANRINEILEIIHQALYTEIENSRGCPYSCTYCSQSVEGLSARRLEPEDFVAQIGAYLRCGKSQVSMVDNDCLFDPNWWRKACKLIKEGRFHELLTLAGNTDPRTLRKFTAEDFVKLAECGFQRLVIGVQGVHPQELRSMGRPENSPEWVLAALPLLHQAGIDTQLHFIDYFPGFDEYFIEFLKAKAAFWEKVRAATEDSVWAKIFTFFPAPGDARARCEALCESMGMTLTDALFIVNGMDRGRILKGRKFDPVYIRLGRYADLHSGGKSAAGKFRTPVITSVRPRKNSPHTIEGGSVVEDLLSVRAKISMDTETSINPQINRLMAAFLDLIIYLQNIQGAASQKML